MTWGRLAFAGLIALGLAACGAQPNAVAAAEPKTRPMTAPPEMPPPKVDGGGQVGLERIPLTIRSGGRTHRFTVEVAATIEQQATGMMFRESIGANEGMLFPYASPRLLSFYMRNTLIPLDLVFIRADGTIARIAADAVPLSEALIPSGEPIVAVLEVAGGRMAALGVAEGDRVGWAGGPRP